MNGGPGIIGDETGVTLKLLAVIMGTAITITGALSGLVAWVRRRDLEEIYMRIGELERGVGTRLDAARQVDALRVERIDQLLVRIEAAARETEARITGRIAELTEEVKELRSAVMRGGCRLEAEGS